MDEKDVRSAITRRTLGNALKTLMMKKPLQEITVSEITWECGYHRQTFYYYFSSINDLLLWVFEDDIAKFTREHPVSDNWEDILRSIFHFLSKNRGFCSSAYRSQGKDVLVAYFKKSLDEEITRIIHTTAGDLIVDPKNAEFLTFVISCALLTHINNWICGCSSWDLEEIIRQMHYITEDLIAGARLRAEKEKKEKISFE